MHSEIPLKNIQKSISVIGDIKIKYQNRLDLKDCLPSLRYTV